MAEEKATYLYDTDPEVELLDKFVLFLHETREKKERSNEKTESKDLVQLL